MTHLILFRKLLYSLLFCCISAWLWSCASSGNRVTRSGRNPDYVIHHKLLVITPLEVYESRTMLQRYRNIPVGDTVDVILRENEEISPATNDVYYKRFKLSVWGLGSRTSTVFSQKFEKNDIESEFQNRINISPGVYPLYAASEKITKEDYTQKVLEEQDKILRSSNVVEYTLLVTSPIEVYMSENQTSNIYKVIPVKDTIRVLLFEKSRLSAAQTRVRYKNLDVYVYGCGIRTKEISRHTMIYGEYLQREKKRPLSLFLYPSDEVEYKRDSYGVSRAYLQNNTKAAVTGSSNSGYSGGTRYSTPTTGATIHTGPRGGQYYYNSKGNKTYVRRK
ncbi:hypothetical protein SAMN04488090_2944 [Siphonobacter aquaeclarae]|uniref:Uncharacterized protein n=2 Tax=Siphonobacter aquaeclarae TaxID=563176 RepID=A0A1G9RLB7_9BACT|nr:hypothetical protein SAMN04488090_2944 [Siphonobacter aquaeclarae]